MFLQLNSIRHYPKSQHAALYMAAGTVEVPMDLIKKLRGMSGAPIMDCKKALAVSA